MSINYTESQTYVLAALPKWFNSDNSIAILEAPAGMGKALPLDEPVLTNEGWVNIGDITLKHSVATENGTFCPILEIHDNDNLEMYLVTFSDGSTVRCCIDHLWEIQTVSMRKDGNFRVKSLREMLYNIQKPKTKKQTYTYSVRLPKPIEFQEQTLADPYTLGYVIGNGHSSEKQLYCAVGIADVLEIVDYMAKSSVLSVRKRTETVSVIALTKEFMVNYNTLGLHRILSGNKFIPTVYFTASVSQRKALLAGLLDSDGTCQNNKALFATTSLTLAKDFVQLVRSLGGTATIGINQRLDKIKPSIEYNIVFRTPFNPFYLSRKALGYVTRTIDIIGNKRIVSAKYIGIQDGRCLLVDSPKHLFITKDYTVTHNTYLVKHFLDRMGRRCKPLILAETNEAVNVLRNSVGNKYVTKTVCSAFNLVLSNIDGNKQVIQHKDPTFDNINIIIIDECSMLSKERLQLIISTCIANNISILLIGHSSQLPPVEERNNGNNCTSPAFTDSFYNDNNYAIPVKFLLKEPVRNTTEIYTFCMQVEELLRKRGVIDNAFTVNSTFLTSYLLDQHGIIALREGRTIILAYSNKKVYEFNTVIRKALYGKVSDEQLFIIGDRIICRQPTYCFNKSISDKLFKIEQILQVKSELLTTNTKATILAVTFKEVAGILCWELLIHSNHFESSKTLGFIYYPVEREDVVALFHKYNNFAIWDKTNNRQKKFDIAHAIGSVYGVDAREIKHDLRHAYAMTIDCAQGSTIENVIVDDNDIKRCIRNRVLELKVRYVGYSRARVNLWRLQ